jgi:hypothetical protein
MITVVPLTTSPFADPLSFRALTISHEAPETAIKRKANAHRKALGSDKDHSFPFFPRKILSFEELQAKSL